MILHECLHVLLDALVPLGDVDVQRVVAAGLAVGPFTPLLEGRDEADARLRDHMVNWIHTHTHRPSNTLTENSCSPHLAAKYVASLSQVTKRDTAWAQNEHNGPYIDYGLLRSRQEGKCIQIRAANCHFLRLVNLSDQSETQRFNFNQQILMTI